MKIPFNRVIAFLKPYADFAAAALAAFLVAKVNVLGLPGLDQNDTQTYLSGGIVYGLTHLGLALGNWQWLKGHHIEIANDDTGLHPLAVEVPKTDSVDVAADHVAP